MTDFSSQSAIQMTLTQAVICKLPIIRKMASKKGQKRFDVHLSFFKTQVFPFLLLLKKMPSEGLNVTRENCQKGKRLNVTRYLIADSHRDNLPHIATKGQCVVPNSFFFFFKQKALKICVHTETDFPK